MTTRTEPPEFEDYVVRIEGYTVTWEYIGEGYQGDYNPDDPEDEPLLRASLTHRKVEDEGETYCTCLPISTPQADLYRAAHNLVSLVIARRGVDGEDWENLLPRHVMDGWTAQELQLPSQNY